MNSCVSKRSTRFVAILTALVILTGQKVLLFGQVSVFGLPGSSGPTQVDERTAKIELALETARVAAEAEMFDLSFDAVKRVCAEGPPIAKPQLQSSLLGGAQANAATRVIAGRVANQVPEVTVQYAAKLFGIVDKWKAKQAPAEKIAEALEQIVFPTGRPNEIMMFNNVPPTNTNSYSYEFSFTKAKPARYLAFEMIELAGKTQTLTGLVEKLEKLRALPSSQAPAVAMLVYAKRVLGQAGEAAKLLEDLLANPVAVDHSLPLYYALTQSVPEGGEASIVSAKTSVPLLNKLLKQNVMRMDIRAAILQQIKQVIESGDQAGFDSYVAMVVESINQVQGGNQNTINYMLENFYRSLADECKRQGKAAMAFEISTRAVDVRADLGQGSVMDVDMMASFAELKPDVQLKALRKMLVDRPLVKLEQFNFAEAPQSIAAPEFFHVKPANEKLKQLLPYEGAKSISLLDLLLNQTESQGNYPALVKELLSNAKENDDVKRFLTVWLNLRNEMRGKPIDEELAKLAKFESDKEYIDWWMNVPSPAAFELVLLRMRKETLSTELQTALDVKDSDVQPAYSSSEIRYQRRLATDKSLVNANRLKHWVVSNEPINWQGEDRPPVWTVNDKQRIECFGGAWYGQLIFRYPLPVNSSIKFTADHTDKKTDGLYCGGVTMLSLEQQQSMCYAMAPNTRMLGLFNAQSSKPARAFEGILKENSLNLKMGEKALEVLEHDAKTVPFVGLASYGARASAFSEVVITSPTAIPREVPMLDEGLTGWSAGLFGHTLPKLTGHIVSNEPGIQTSDGAQNLSPIWRIVDNELRAGKPKSDDDQAKQSDDAEQTQPQVPDPFSTDEENAQNASQTKPLQSNMTYSRPLCEGEHVEYEFYHTPETQNASPSLGRIAYLMRDGKISLKWISTSNRARKATEESNFLGDDPNAEVLAPVKLELNAWNRVQLKIEGGKVVLSVAGTDVYRRPLEKETVARFGFYCEPQKDQVQIRNVILKGDWPTELPKDLWELN